MTKYGGQERRQYIRLSSVFPIGFRFISPGGENFITEWLQGFTNNISSGGICLTVHDLKSEPAELIRKGEALLLLRIQIPLSAKPVFCHARPMWLENEGGEPAQYSIGLSYVEIEPRQRKRIINYAYAKMYIPRFVIGVTIILFVAFTASSYVNFVLMKYNRGFVNNLIRIIQELSIAKQEVKRINTERDELNLKLAATQLSIRNVAEEKNRLEMRLSDVEERLKHTEETRIQNKLKELNSMIQKLNMDKTSLQEQITGLQKKEGSITEDLLMLTKKKVTLEKINLDNMYEWLKIHQNPRTGLIASFEGDNDIANWAFTYDQALVACLYARFLDFERARKIFDFYKMTAKRIDGGFLNAYYANDMQPAEYTVHSGPNIWLGIAILQYTNASGDPQYMNLARHIADWVMYMQKLDKEGGIKGGPTTNWYSTEHNLDAYAFLNMMHLLTKEAVYADSRDKILNWLLRHTYDQTDVPIKRGKGDSTIATDTYAWSIASIGPEGLEKIGMHPDKIIEFAEQTCVTEIEYRRPEGTLVKVKGFDFASSRNLARGGIISCEWTAQMILSFKIMGKYYQEKGIKNKSLAYEWKADDYMSQLAKMIISSPSPSGQGQGCLPYASQDNADTGHGWTTPKGSCTGSVSATAYTLFAYYGYNPLELSNQ